MAGKQSNPAQEVTQQVPLTKASYELSKKEVDREAARKLQDIQLRKKKLNEEYRNEPRRAVTLAPSYRRHWGNVLTVSVNTCTVAVPVDGKAYLIPETFAAEVDRHREAADRSDKQADACKNFQSNVERAPGDLPLIPQKALVQ